MGNLRKYGIEPFSVAVIHGGPGAAGEMGPVAREVAASCGVLEPLQTASSLQGQVYELKAVLEQNGEVPLTLIGFSWGAWLSFIVATNYPALIKKLILIGSGPYEEKYAEGIQETRLKRLNEEEKTEIISIIDILNNPEVKDKNTVFVRFGALFSKADAYDPIISEFDKPDIIDYQFDIFQRVWIDASELRRSGKLLEHGKHIKCPVVAIHGDYDPHPSEGVQKPLSAKLENFRFILLKNCGHRPWIEREAREEFYRILKEELRHNFL